MQGAAAAHQAHWASAAASPSPAPQQSAGRTAAALHWLCCRAAPLHVRTLIVKHSIPAAIWTDPPSFEAGGPSGRSCADDAIYLSQIVHFPGRLSCLQQVPPSEQKLTCNHVADHEGVWILRPRLHMALRLLIRREHLHCQLTPDDASSPKQALMGLPIWSPSERAARSVKAAR